MLVKEAFVGAGARQTGSGRVCGCTFSFAFKHCRANPTRPLG